MGGVWARARSFGRPVHPCASVGMGSRLGASRGRRILVLPVGSRIHGTGTAIATYHYVRVVNSWVGAFITGLVAASRRTSTGGSSTLGLRLCHGTSDGHCDVHYVRVFNSWVGALIMGLVTAIATYHYVSVCNSWVDALSREPPELLRVAGLLSLGIASGFCIRWGCFECLCFGSRAGSCRCSCHCQPCS